MPANAARARSLGGGSLLPSRPRLSSKESTDVANLPKCPGSSAQPEARLAQTAAARGERQALIDGARFAVVDLDGRIRRPGLPAGDRAVLGSEEEQVAIESVRANPYALASALQKIDAYARRLPMQATPSTAHLFIIQPFLGVSAGIFANLFSTHPPVAKRIERLTGRPVELR